MPLFPPQDYRKTIFTHRRGTRADQPAAADVLEGTLYYVTDEGVTERSDGTVWESYTDTASGNLINVSAGTTSQNLSNFVLSNSNNVTFGLSGSTITAIAGAAAGSVNFSAGTTSQNLTAVVFSNSNNVSFGLNGSTITASISTSLTNIRVSAGTTSNLLSAVTFSNANGVSFGLDASTITASISINTSLTNINVSAGTTSQNLSNLVFSNSNGVSFGLNGSTITGSVAIGAGLSAGLTNFGNVVGDTGLASQRLVFVGSDNITLSGSTNAGSMTISISGAGGGGGGGVTHSAYANIDAIAAMAFTTSRALNAATIGFQPFHLGFNLTASYLRRLYTVSITQSTFSGTSANTSWSISAWTTFPFVLYSQGIGASSQSLMSMFSNSTGFTSVLSVTHGAVGSEWTYTAGVSYPLYGGSSSFSTTVAVTSASYFVHSSILSNFTNMRFIDIPFGTSLAPGFYWMGFGHSATASNNGPVAAGNNTIQFREFLFRQSNQAGSAGLMGLEAAGDSVFPIVPGHGDRTTINPLESSTVPSIDISSISQRGSVIHFQLKNFS